MSARACLRSTPHRAAPLSWPAGRPQTGGSPAPSILARPRLLQKRPAGWRAPPCRLRFRRGVLCMAGGLGKCRTQAAELHPAAVPPPWVGSPKDRAGLGQGEQRAATCLPSPPIGLPASVSGLCSSLHPSRSLASESCRSQAVKRPVFSWQFTIEAQGLSGERAWYLAERADAAPAPPWKLLLSHL